MAVTTAQPEPEENAAPLPAGRLDHWLRLFAYLVPAVLFLASLVSVGVFFLGGSPVFATLSVWLIGIAMFLAVCEAFLMAK